MVPRNYGPYAVIDGKGFHEVVVFRDPQRNIAHFSQREATDVMRAFRERLIVLKEEPCVGYVSIFQNHGKEAGASVAHPHAQIIALPVIPTDVTRSLEGAKRFYEKNNKTVHTTIIDWERQEKTRIIYENKTMVAFCPFTSRAAFEIRIFPKVPQARFEDFNEANLPDVADALRYSLRMLYDTLEDPAYNFFLHTAPVNHGDHAYYHWHFEILPKTAIWAGFELGTGIEISTLEPERAATFLREHLRED
jgi:UDPglucose--hexose-1-phosphate uridylyltransferase